MTPNIWNSKTEICDEEDLRKKNHSRVISPTVKNKKGTRSGYKTCTKIEEWFGFKTKLKWKNIALLIFLHIGSLYSFYTVDILGNITTVVWMIFLGAIQAIGITAGVHRLWSHHAYKAKLPLRALLLIFYTVAVQNKISDWVQDHRVHHKYTDTDADPHNSNRGFFFSHIGWLMMKKHSEVIRRGREIDMSDVLTDPVVVFDDKYSVILRFIFCFGLPVVIPVYGWDETWIRSVQMQWFFRYVIGLNCTWSVNSLAHIWGSKPYDAHINPANNKLVAFLTYGEGWHNYHHVFPWDYKADELGNYMLNITTMFIDFFAKIGWAYDLKQPSQQLVMSVVTKRGDGSHHMWDPVAYPNSKIEE
ncbi:acyl-CoA Delta(11) desaturase-like isoform X2 [Odontomachus brunneus]|nr:acyl-CoA Delta(11) desaturase-like isoform X2 [Odontomachus brunneus]XP_032666232.1 acyl-CoA Delta(11) desaturase-like isoform X2 [Odontomachus brunneus]XP_032666233.1 acyl-CoA Delta(11) desaturase-like isoform X2 [Odontomachus brunneus]